MSKSLREIYTDRYNSVLINLSKSLELDIKKLMTGRRRIDKISVRPKSIERFLTKAKKLKDGKKKYIDPINQIQDQIGTRIVNLYLSDIEETSKFICKYYRPIEISLIVPDTEKEFDYFGKHFILLIPDHLKPEGKLLKKTPNFFELQVVTLFQHAWAEANHDLGYKPEAPLTKDQIRKIAFTAAQAWGADLIFDELQRESKDEDKRLS